MILYEKRDKETGKEYAYRVMKDNIMTLNLKPGDFLVSESDLSEKLNISRTPIREVIMKLRNEFLIEVKPQIGTYISLIDKKLINEAAFMRYTMEKEVLKECIKDFPDDILIELEKNLFAQKLTAEKINSQIEFHELDKEFHRLLFLGANKINIWNSILNISTHYNRMRLLQEMKSDRKLVIQQHEQYVATIKNKSIENTTNIVEMHVKEPMKYWDNVIDKDYQIAKYFK
jgi:DNA-binding GntR family transcriptional regulator